MESTPIEAELLREDMTVFDTVYNPLETRLLREAREKGARTISGLAMFVNQAAGQFEMFTGQRISRDFMRRIVEENLRT
jgi:shikimate 5-dehydrogenase